MSEHILGSSREIHVVIDVLDHGYSVTAYLYDRMDEAIIHACETRESVGKSVTGMLLEIEETAAIEAEARVNG